MALYLFTNEKLEDFLKKYELEKRVTVIIKKEWKVFIIQKENIYYMKVLVNKKANIFLGRVLIPERIKNGEFVKEFRFIDEGLLLFTKKINNPAPMLRY